MKRIYVARLVYAEKISLPVFCEITSSQDEMLRDDYYSFDFIDFHFFQTFNKKRNIGGRGSPPHLVAVIPLHRDVDVNELLYKFQQLCDENEKPVHNDRLNGFTMNVPKLKHTFTVSCESRDLIWCGL